ncbi:MAG: hypothetical protein PHT60_13540 [Acidiphilium sp.]|nr:hypothetical protein [Acidiphilium sp.]MDD4936786.1 hypothetical protein [Acidiphilium sp.]
MSGVYDSAPGVLTEAQKVDVRRFCGYPAYGAGAAGFESWRFFQAYGTLEYRMNNFAPAEVAVVVNYLATLNALEAAVPLASGNLDTDAAASWQHNQREVRDRDALFDGWRRRLCGFIGVPPGGALESSGITLIV